MMKMKNMMKNDDYSSSSYNSDNAFDMFSDMFDQHSNYKSSSDYNNQMGRMSQFKNMFNSMRFKRAAGDNLDLGDRLFEKLAEQKHQMEAKIGNMTCVMRELNVLDASNNIDVQAMKRDIQKYNMPSEWFKNKYEHLLDTCYEMATNLPAEIAENSVITRTSRTRLSPTLVPWRTSFRRPSSLSTSSSPLLCSCCTAGDGLHDRWDVRSLLSAGPTWPGAGLLRCSLSNPIRATTNRLPCLQQLAILPGLNPS